MKSTKKLKALLKEGRRDLEFATIGRRRWWWRFV